MFKILSLDGGGARGAFTSGFLLELENKIGSPLTDYFDLIAGTSTGGVIAVLLALGYPMEKIIKIYTEELKQVFTPNEPYFKSILGKTFVLLTNPLTRYFTGVNMNELLKSKYSYEGTISLLKKYTSNIKLSDIDKTRLVIPSTNLIHGSPYIFKTHHLPNNNNNNKIKSYDFYTLDVILSTAAAPSLFDPVTLPGYGIYSDGGIWANNPGLAAYAEAVKISHLCNRDIDPKFTSNDISVLSVGTGHAIDNFSPPYLKAGIKWWSGKLLELMFEAQTQSSSYYLEQILHKKYYRVNFKRPHPNWGQIDDYKYANEMAQMGRLMAQKKYSEIKNMFLNNKKEQFVPFK